MVDHTPQIEITNLTESGNVFSYPIIFLKGKVTCDQCDTLLNGILLVQNENDSFEFEVLEGNFKFINQLTLGFNKLLLHYKFVNHFSRTTIQLQRRSSCNSRILKLVYVVPRGDAGHFQSSSNSDNSIDSACRKIVMGAKLIQSLIAERLCEQGFGRKTFHLFSLQGSEPVCEVHQSSLTKSEIHALSGEQIWNVTARELLEKKCITESVKVLAFLSCTEYKNSVPVTTKNQYSDALANVKGYVACGKGHLAMLGSTGLHSWASDIGQVFKFLTSQDPIDANLFDDSGFRGTMGGCYATSLGSALHELGHVFDLVHSNCGIMSRGFEDIDLFFTMQKRKVKRSTRDHSNIDVTIALKPMYISNMSFQSGFQSCEKERLPKDGRAFFHTSANILLSAHPWFCEEIQKCGEKIQICGLEVKSAVGIRLIELHSQEGDLIKFWDFSRNPSPLRRFALNVFDVKKVVNPIVMVQDRTGQMLSQSLDIKF